MITQSLPGCFHLTRFCRINAYIFTITAEQQTKVIEEVTLRDIFIYFYNYLFLAFRLQLPP